MRCAIFGTGPRATHVVLAGDRVPAGTVLVTPALSCVVANGNNNQRQVKRTAPFNYEQLTSEDAIQ